MLKNVYKAKLLIKEQRRIGADLVPTTVANRFYSNHTVNCFINRDKRLKIPALYYGTFQLMKTFSFFFWGGGGSELREISHVITPPS